MNAQEFLSNDGVPSAGFPAPMVALWRVHRGDWEAAHALVQDDSSADASWVHAHLHRVEGDLGNAGYWYRRAGRPTSAVRLEEERVLIVDEMLFKTNKQT